MLSQTEERDSVKARFIGVVGGGLLGAFLGAGTGIVGGVFGGVAGASIFTVIGAVWGFSLGPDIERVIRRWRSR